jgi:vacuolar-type H+-ATPase catalytic subunit A/Vma1
VATDKGSITSVQTVYVPADELSDVGVSAIMGHLDTVVILSRDIAARGYYPAINPILSSSSALNRSIVGEKHYEIATKAVEMLNEHQRLTRIVAIVGEAELSPHDQLIYQRAKKILNYMTQAMFTTEVQTGKTGAYVKREKTVQDVHAIITGAMDSVPAERLMYIGDLESAGLFTHSKITQTAAPAQSSDGSNDTKENVQKEESSHEVKTMPDLDGSKSVPVIRSPISMHPMAGIFQEKGHSDVNDVLDQNHEKAHTDKPDKDKQSNDLTDKTVRQGILKRWIGKRIEEMEKHIEGKKE